MEKRIIRDKLVLNDSERIQCELSIMPDDFGGKEYFLREICKEAFTEAELHLECENFRKTGESEWFSWVYMLSPEFGVRIDQSIYLYHFNDKYVDHEQRLFGWQYPENKKYMGDTWWFEDEEILADLQRLSTIDFLAKYQGYIG